MQRKQITTKKEKEDIFLVAKSAYKEMKAETAVSVLFPWCALPKFAWLVVLTPLLALLEPPQRLFSAFSDSTVSILHKNPTNALYILTPLIHTVTLLHVSALKGPFSGSTDSLCEQRQQNTCQTASSMQHTTLNVVLTSGNVLC